MTSSELRGALEQAQLFSKEVKMEYMVIVVRLPDDSIEITTITSNIRDKIDFILREYDSNLRFKDNKGIRIDGILIG